MGPSCPDRMFSVNASRNIIRRTALYCAGFCERRNLHKQYQEIFLIVLARTVLLYSKGSRRNRCKKIPDIIAMAERTYERYVADYTGWIDYDDYCGKLRVFLNSCIKMAVESPNEENARGRAAAREFALEHRDTAFNEYVSPQDMDFGDGATVMTDVVFVDCDEDFSIRRSPNPFRLMKRGIFTTSL